MTTLQSMLDAYVGGGQAPGAVALVARGRAVEVAAAGFVDVERSAPMARDSIFRVASITKPITAAAVMILVEDGVFALDEPVDRWLPEIAGHRVLRTPGSPLTDTVAAERPVTVADLLTFRAGWGFPDDFSLPGVAPLFERLLQGPPQPQHIPAPDAWMSTLAGIPALNQPGEAWLYNTCSDLQGVLIARASEQSLPDFLHQRIFEPLGMVDTGFAVPDDKLDRFTGYYRAAEDGLELIDPPNGAWRSVPAFPMGSGGLVSTVDDWLAFGRTLLGHGRQILSRESIAAMTTDQLTQSQRDGSELFLAGQGWGYGGSVDVAPIDPWNAQGRYGWVGGTGTCAHVVASTGQVTILMTQLEMNGPTAPTSCGTSGRTQPAERAGFRRGQMLGCSTSGSRTWNRVSPGRETTLMSPRWRWVITR